MQLDAGLLETLEKYEGGEMMSSSFRPSRPGGPREASGGPGGTDPRGEGYVDFDKAEDFLDEGMEPLERCALLCALLCL